NFLTITTEFIGVNLALAYFGVSHYISVPIAAAALVAITASGSFRRWERFMFIFIVANFLVIPLAVFSHPHASAFFHGFVISGVHGGFTSTSVLLIIAIVGTTVAPWQLFFQQSNIVDKRITPRWISYERADTVIGSFITVFAASLIMAVVAAAFAGHPLFGHYKNAEAVADGLSRYVGHASGALFSIILLNASLIGAASVTLATSYAFGDVFGMRHSLHRSWREAKFFYASFTVMVVAAAAIVLVATGRLQGLITTGVQALAGVLLPSATVFLLLLCNDKEVLGPWVNRPWLNVITFGIVSLLLVLSLALMVTTVFPHIDVRDLMLGMGSALVLTYLVGGVGYWRVLEHRPPELPMPRGRRDRWRMPPLNRLERPVWSRGRVAAMYSLRGYLVLAVALLAVKAFQLGLHR
ncbi:MAG: NRAMP family divalent metal transporter, partial [Acidimicrobiales bacterium]